MPAMKLSPLPGRELKNKLKNRTQKRKTCSRLLKSRNWI
jgi:hypothetical protein